MGAVPGGRVLISLEVEPYRSLTRPTAVVHHPMTPMLVLGSTQVAAVVDAERAAGAGVSVLRRRAGGGAVLIDPATTVWVDLWIPAGGPLWDNEPRRTARRAGSWWCEALRMAGGTGLALGDGGGDAGGLTRLICFAGLGAGEVHATGRKVVGLTQWRSREGALVMGCAYRQFDARGLIDLLAVDPAERPGLITALESATAGYGAVGAVGFTAAHLIEHLGAGWDHRAISAGTATTTTLSR